MASTKEYLDFILEQLSDFGLEEKQIRQLERAVTGYFDYIEDLIGRENVFTMEEFEKNVNAFLEFRQYKILKDNGRISHKQAMAPPPCWLL